MQCRLRVLVSLAIVALSGTTLALTASGDDRRTRRDKWQTEDFEDWRNRPHEPFADGAAMFDAVKKTLREQYVDAGLTEDDLYRAAVQGMLSGIDSRMASWNRLMTPSEYAELMSDAKGKVIGIGVEIGFDAETGRADVIDVIPGSPGDKAGIVRGDQILKIDGVDFRGKQLRDVVYAIRGIDGSTVELLVLHDDAVRKLRMKRENLVLDTVGTQNLGDGLAMVSIRYFTETTPTLLKKALIEIAAHKPSGLIVDLRGNEGGVFESAIDSIRLLLPQGRPIVIQKKRGGETKVLEATEEPILKDIPMVVLINGSTKSGAEMMAAALKESAGATAIGTPTFGKWSAQRVDELPNHYAIKYTTATFLPPTGVNLAGKGLTPDIGIEQAPEIVKQLQRQPDLAKRMDSDLALKTAVSVLKLRH